MENLPLLSQPLQQLRAWLPPLKREIWILSFGQLILFIGQGFTLVYASIYFVNELGFSPTQVGLAQGSIGVSGLIGRFFAGNALNSPKLGRRGTLLLSAVIAALGSFLLASAHTFAVLVAGNLLLGLGISLYWPATLTVTTDLTEPEHLTEAMALTRLADHLGLAVGALIAGQYIAAADSYPVLFIAKGILYLLFSAVIWFTIAETRHTDAPLTTWADWGQALRDRPFVLYLLANLFFPIYASQSSSTLPLYLANFMPGGNTETGFSGQFISYFFVWHVVLKICLQLPLTRVFRSRSHSSLLIAALIVWCLGFVMIWLPNAVPQVALVAVVSALACLAIADVLYAPSASALVGELAPASLRGIYFSLESQCWAIGFLIGPSLGGWALDHPTAAGEKLWLYFVLSAVIALGLVILLQRESARQTLSVED